MTRCTHLLRPHLPLVCIRRIRLAASVRFLHLCLRPSPALAAEHLFLRKQRALSREHENTYQRATTDTRSAMT